MLNTIISRFLNISLDEANALLEIYKFEKRFQKEQEHKDQKINPQDIRTQAELINFLQIVGQSQWFKGHDRTIFPKNIDDKEIQQKYFNLFKQFGIVDEVKYHAAQPDFSLVLGSSESQVALRVSYLAKDLQAGNTPKHNLIFGLGCNRDLGVSVPEKEEKSKIKLLEQKKETTEMGMVSLITTECLENFNKEHEGESLEYQAVEVSTPAKSRLDPSCVKTTDTALELKRILETDEKFSKLPRPLILASYSNQPFAERQARDIQEKLGSDYKIIAVGNELTSKIFNKYPNSISICLGELARTINISYNRKDYLKSFDVELTKEELEELQELCLSKQAKSDVSPPSSPVPGKASRLGTFGSGASLSEKDKENSSSVVISTFGLRS